MIDKRSVKRTLTRLVDPSSIEEVKSEWIDIIEKTPQEDKVVLAACNTYDNGWVVHTVSWSEKSKWLIAGISHIPLEYQVASLKYSHWRELPSDVPVISEVIDIKK
jgi:hypothetical protein